MSSLSRDPAGSVDQLTVRLDELRTDLSHRLGQVIADADYLKKDQHAETQSRVAKLRTQIENRRRELGAEQKIIEQRAEASFQQLEQDRKNITSRLRDLLPTMPDSQITEANLCRAHHVYPLALLGHLDEVRDPDSQAAFGQTPAFAPLVDSGHIFMEGPIDEKWVYETIKNLIAQAFMAAPAGQMITTVFDPQMVDVLAGFQPENMGENSIWEQIHPSTTGLEKSLQKILTHIMSVGASMAGQYSSMGDLVRDTGQHEHPYQCLVLIGMPALMSEAAMYDLERIVEQGRSKGVSVIVQFEPGGRDGIYDRFLRLAEGSTHLRDNGTGPQVRQEGRWRRLKPLAELTITEQQKLMSTVSQAARHGALPKVEFNDLLSTTPFSSAEGMQVTVGRRGTAPVRFTLGDNVSNLHNILIGGAVGTGKTNLLKVLIYSLASAYGPDELEMFLLDFKEGVEFQQFTDSAAGPGLPNARVVSLESDAAFGIATLTHFAQELDRRSELFKQAGVANIASYRQRDGVTMPRWLLVADEFQVMFDEAHYEQATALLETIARKGRAYGLHIVLASQTLSGIRFAGGKDEAIFGQFPVRIVLNMPRTESEIFLGTGNTAAAGLRYRGQAVLNQHHGNVDDNVTFVVAYAPDDFLRNVQNELAARHSGLPTRVYLGSLPARSTDLLTAATEEHRSAKQGLPLWVGQECSVAAEPTTVKLRNAPGSNLLVLGPETRYAIGILQTAILSAARAKPGLTVWTYSYLDPEEESWLQLDLLEDVLGRLGCTTRRIDEDGLDDAFLELDEWSRDQDLLFLILGAENSSFYDTAEMALLRDKIGSWSRNGVHLLGHWTDARFIPLPPSELKNDFHTQIFVDVPIPGISEVTDIIPSSIAESGPGKALVYQSSRHREGVRQITAIEPLTEQEFEVWAKQ